MRLTPSAFGLAALALIAVGGTAMAQATIADCEKIQAADAYNQCLAKFGPSGKNLNMEPEKPGDVKASPEEAAAGAGKAKGGARHAARGGGRRGSHARRGGGHGRQHMTISVKRRHK